ncbi:MAG: 2Fe-2S iron-sulfur cluster-binding protein [Paracoccaceae bacterium]|nr:2Fe-2S iron-sulfur cluster-binding protein [Paracoccaceae bacterium]
MSGWRHDTLGSEIDRDRPLSFTFDGQIVRGFEGDTLASALMASDHRILGRSFKYHRPRGLWGLGAEEPNAVFDVRHDGSHMPNARATLTYAQDGMQVRSVNAWPDARRDIFGLLDLAHRFLPAGFYYKTFLPLPWRFYEPMIRRMAGLGRVDPHYAPPADATQVSATCEVLVIGAGPAGLAAAKAAAEAGRVVWLVEDARHLGGSLRWRGGEIDGAPWRDFVAETQAAIEAAGGRVLTDTTLWGAFDHGTFAAWQRGPRPRHWRLRADRCILAAGAIERPVWFENNDRPGVMSAEAALHHLQLYGCVPGKRILLATACDSSLPVAQALAQAGAEVTLIDSRPEAPETDGIPQITGARIKAALGRRGVTGAMVNGKDMPCDTILCAGGMTPSVHLWCQAGGKLDWDDGRDMLLPRPGTGPMTVVGAAAGTLDLAIAVAEGRDAGAGKDPKRKPSQGAQQTIPFRPDPALPGRQWIDLQNDVTLKDVALAAREGFTSVEHLKRYTTLGMATDQGRTSNFAGLSAMAALTNRTIPETGTTTYRPPFQPVPLNAIAGPARGALYHPPKRLTLEDAHKQNGARFREYGGWLRPAVYGDGDETALAQAEALTARQSVGIYDASPLGKLEVIGPGAAALLDFTGYVRMSTLKPGRARYGFMLSEAGIVYDDGVVLRLAEDHFVVSASSSHVDGVRYRLEDARQDLIGRDQVFIHDVTQGFVTLTVTGPKARALCHAAGIPLPELPHMGVGDIPYQGDRMRVARVSFTGDASYELSVPTSLAEGLHRQLDHALAGLGGCWIGLEAVMILRAEKGFILVGKDTDGSTMPQDLGWGGPRLKRADEYLGKRSLFTAEAQSGTRRQLVGLRVPEGGTVIETGSHLIPTDGPRRSLGFVTSSYVSPILGRPIALALLENGRNRIGETVRLFNDGIVRDAEVTLPCAFDPKGERLHG